MLIAVVLTRCMVLPAEGLPGLLGSDNDRGVGDVGPNEDSRTIFARLSTSAEIKVRPRSLRHDQFARIEGKNMSAHLRSIPVSRSLSTNLEMLSSHILSSLSYAVSLRGLLGTAGIY
jgi:hypothetical protein